MISLNNFQVIEYPKSGNERTKIRADILVDTRTELPKFDYFDGYELVQGSITLIIQDDKLAIFGGDNKWYINGEVVE